MKKLTTIILSTACAFAVGSAFADGLTVDNKTKYPSTMKINNSFCTSAGPDGIGVTKAGARNTLSSWQVGIVLNLAGCSGSSCSADIYSDATCGDGDKIGSGSVNTSDLSVTIDKSQTAAGYNIDFTAGTLTINPTT